MLKKNKKLMTDEQRRELIDIYHLHTNQELADIFGLTLRQLSGQARTMGLNKRVKN